MCGNRVLVVVLFGLVGGLAGCPQSLPADHQACDACSEGEECVDGVCDCAPQCVDKECGLDGCGGLCGVCPPGAPLCEDGLCRIGCLAQCHGKLCGPDGCGGSCGACPPDEECAQWGQCIASESCFDKCQGMECGQVDDCWCGPCAVDEYCSLAGKCVQVANDCAGACLPDDCGVKYVGGGVDCDCGDTCPPGEMCNQVLNMCECFPTCADPDTGKPYECGDDGCGYGCGACGQGECVDHKCVCYPTCDGKECGSDGCGGTCGSCPGGAVCASDWKCYQDCVGMEYTALDDVQKVVYEAVGKGGHPGEALDIDGDPDTCAPAGDCEAGLNNQMSGLMEQMEAFVDTDAELANMLDDGTRVTVAECIGLNLDGEPFTVNVYRGIPVEDLGVCDYQHDNCPYYIDSSSIDAAGCKPMSTFDNATIVNGKLTAGGFGYLYLFDGFMIAPEFSLLSMASMARMTGTVVEVGGGELEVHDGLIGYAINKAEFLEQLSYIDDSELPIGVDMLQNIFDMFLEPDVDANFDGELDSASMAVKFETIPGTIVGIAASGD